MSIIRRNYIIKKIRLNNSLISTTRFIILVLESYDIYYYMSTMKSTLDNKIKLQLKNNYCTIYVMTIISYLYKSIMKRIEDIRYNNEYIKLHND